VTETPSPHVIDADTLSGGLKPIRQVILSLGSNLGDREANLQGAVDALRDTPDVVVVEVSPVYETDPVGGPEESGPYLNVVLLADTTLAVEMLLERAHAIENDPVDLIETLAQRIADLCLADRRVTATAVTIHKPSAPITVPFDDVVLTVQRRAGESL